MSADEYSTRTGPNNAIKDEIHRFYMNAMTKRTDVPANTHTYTAKLSVRSDEGPYEILNLKVTGSVSVVDMVLHTASDAMREEAER